MQNRTFGDIFGSDGCWALSFEGKRPSENIVLILCVFEQRLVIELDGGHHAVNQDYDHCRSEWLQSQGLVVLGFWNHEVMNRVEEIKEVIVRHLLTPHPDLPPQGGKGNERIPYHCVKCG